MEREREGGSVPDGFVRSGEMERGSIRSGEVVPPSKC